MSAISAEKITAVNCNESVRIEKFIRAPLERVWTAWVDPQVISRWLGPAVIERCEVTSMSVTAGGTYRIVMHSSGGEQFVLNGRYVEVSPHRRLSFSWSWEGEDRHESLVTVELSNDGASTKLTLIHANFADAESCAAHQRGWQGSFEKLDRLYDA